MCMQVSSTNIPFSMTVPNMLRVVVVLTLVAVVAANVPYIKTKEEIQVFKEFLDRSQMPSASNVNFNSGHSPLANIEENSGFFEGDILLSDRQKELLVEAFATGSRNGLLDPDRLWPEGTLVYDVDAGAFDASQLAAIEAGVEDLRNVSCVKFRRKNAEDFNYVLVTGAPGGCFASVGFQDRGVHNLNLQLNTPGLGCFRHGTIVHEFLHTLGFRHMQSTHDRDDWVEIVWDNIAPASASNFFIYDNDTVSHYGEDYDYGSCLHYSEYAFSINGDRTIVPKQEYDGVIGQRIGLSESDILKLNRLYQCPGYENW